MKIHEYNEMMRYLTRRGPSNKQQVASAESYNWEQGDWTNPDDESVGNTKILEDFVITDEMRRRPNVLGGRVGYQSGQLVQPGPGRQGYGGGDDTVVDRTVRRYQYDDSVKKKLKTLYDDVQKYEKIYNFRTPAAAKISKDKIKTRLNTFASEFKKITGRLPVANEIRAFGVASQAVTTGKEYLIEGKNFMEETEDMLKTKWRTREVPEIQTNIIKASKSEKYLKPDGTPNIKRLAKDFYPDKELADARKQIRETLKRETDYVPKVNVPGDITSAKQAKKNALEAIKIAQKKAGIKTTKQADQVIDKILSQNEIYQKMSVEDIAKDKDLLKRLRLRIDPATGDVTFDGYTKKSPVRGKVFTDFELAQHAKNKAGTYELFAPDHIIPKALRKQNVGYPTNFQPATYIENSHFDNARKYLQANPEGNIQAIDNYLASNNQTIRFGENAKYKFGFKKPIVFDSKTGTSNIVESALNLNKNVGDKLESKKKLAEIIERGPEGIKFLNKQAVAQTMWKAIGDKGGKICSPRIVKKAEGGRIGFAEKTCGLAFATKDPAGYMAEVKKNKDALNAFKLASQSKKGSDILKAARAVARDTMNPVGWIGGELLISGGITAAMLGEGYTTRKSIDDGLAWFLPKSVLKSRLNEIEDMAKKEGVDFETLMPFFQLETIADEHEQQEQLYLKNTDPLYAWSPQQLQYFSNKKFGKSTSELSDEEVEDFINSLEMPSASGRGGKFYRQQAIESTLAGIEDANKNYGNIVKNLKEPFEEESTDWVIPGVLKQELENIADMSQTERAKANQLKSLKKTYDKGVDLTVEGQRFIDKDISFEDWVHQKGKGDLFFNEFQRGPDRREFLTYNLFNPVKEEPYKMEFPGREPIDFSAVPYAIGGRVGLKNGKRPFSLSRRGFLQWLAGIAGTAVAGGTGLLKLGKGAKTVAPKVTEEVVKRSADGMPVYIDNLISVVQSKGVKKLVDSNINKYPDTVHTYKGVELTQDATGSIKIQKDDYTQRNHIQIEKGQINVKDEGLETQKSFQEPDEYIEGSVRPDRDGKLKDFEEGLDADVHKQFEEIANEANYDNYLPGIDDLD